jgi:hypothetical protein
MLTPRRVQYLVNEGVIPKAIRGEYPLIGSVQGYIHYLQQQLSKGAKKLDEDARLRAAQANLRELELDKARGTLVEADAVEETVVEVISVLNAELSALASRVSVDCVGKNATEIKAILSDETRHIQENIHKGLGTLGANVRRVASRRATAKKPGPGRVGRRGKNPASRSRGAGTVSK